MKYNQPFGVVDTNAAYVNGNPETGTRGSIPPAAQMEYPQREIVAVIQYAYDHGYKDQNGDACAAPANTDLTQLLKAIFGIIYAQKLTANYDLYVNSSTGNNTSAASHGGDSLHPFLTLQSALDWAQANLDLDQRYTLTFICTGTFTAGVHLNGRFKGQLAASQVLFNMTAATVNASNDSCFYVNFGEITVQGGVYSATGTGSAQGCVFLAGGGGHIVWNGGGTLGSAAGAHMLAQGGLIEIVNAYTINGNSPYHWCANPLSQITHSGGTHTITLTGTPAFSAAFAYVAGGFLSVNAFTFSGSATGVRYSVTGYGTIYTGGGGSTYLPGNSAGSTTAGIYS